MRRKDREVTDESKIDGIILACDCLRLGFCDGKSAYVVPMNFGFSHGPDGRRFYFHSAGQGRKVDLIRQNGCAGFELDTGHRLKQGEDACAYGFSYQSVIGSGEVREITEAEEKRKALDLLMRHYVPQGQWQYPEALLERMFIFVLNVEEISCKEHD